LSEKDLRSDESDVDAKTDDCLLKIMMQVQILL